LENKNNLTPLIIFREGLSGNYLKNLIQDSDQEINFRVDNPFMSWHHLLQKVKKKYACECAHLKNVDLKKAAIQYYPILTIQVYKKIYHGIYNNFHKKLIVENQNLATDFERWHDNAKFWYDTAYYNIKEYYRLFQQDQEQNTLPNIINFDHILESPYIEKIFHRYLDRDISENIRCKVESYTKLQMTYDLSGNETDMHDILKVIPDHEFERTPWFAAYCIFKYELAQKFNEDQRLWTIDEIGRLIDKDWLRDIANQYNK
jgi:hypothetical protein